MLVTLILLLACQQNKKANDLKETNDTRTTTKEDYGFYTITFSSGEKRELKTKPMVSVSKTEQPGVYNIQLIFTNISPQYDNLSIIGQIKKGEDTSYVAHSNNINPQVIYKYGKEGKAMSVYYLVPVSETKGEDSLTLGEAQLTINHFSNKSISGTFNAKLLSSGNKMVILKEGTFGAKLSL